jgi:hypothetical protein
MQYVFNEDQKKILEQMCDVCLKAGGMGCLPGVLEIIKVLNCPSQKESD